MRRLNLLLISMMVLLATGCTEQVIADAARGSLTSFINTVLTTAVSSAINGR